MGFGLFGFFFAGFFREGVGGLAFDFPCTLLPKRADTGFCSFRLADCALVKVRADLVTIGRAVGFVRAIVAHCHVRTTNNDLDIYDASCVRTSFNGNALKSKHDAEANRNNRRVEVDCDVTNIADSHDDDDHMAQRPRNKTCRHAHEQPSPSILERGTRIEPPTCADKSSNEIQR